MCWFAALAIWKSSNVTLKSSRLTITTLWVSEKSYIRNVNTFEINQTNVFTCCRTFLRGRAEQVNYE